MIPHQLFSMFHPQNEKLSRPCSTCSSSKFQRYSHPTEFKTILSFTKRGASKTSWKLAEGDGRRFLFRKGVPLEMESSNVKQTFYLNFNHGFNRGVIYLGVHNVFAFVRSCYLLDQDSFCLRLNIATMSSNKHL